MQMYDIIVLVLNIVTYRFYRQLFEISHDLPHRVGIVLIEAHLDAVTWTCEDSIIVVLETFTKTVSRRF